MTKNSVDFDLVIRLVVIFIVSILPCLFYLLVQRRVKQRWQSRLRRTRTMNFYQYHQRSPGANYRHDYSQQRGTKYFIGDPTCRNNAHSPYIRCAINPSGPCEDCSHYEKSN